MRPAVRQEASLCLMAQNLPESLQNLRAASCFPLLAATGVRGLVNLVAAASPEGVDALAAGRKWSLFFIDGDHEGSAPVRDADACAAHAEEDALILFHDLAAPAVSAALDQLHERGWQTRVYNT